MDAQQLYVMVDGKPQGSNHWFCGKCRRTIADWGDNAQSLAEQCCRNFVCEKHGDQGERSHYCNQCWGEQQAAKEAKALADAELVEDYDGWIWHPEVSQNDGFFDSVSSLVEYWQGECVDEESGTSIPLPEFAHCCTEKRFELDLERIIEHEADSDHHEDIRDWICGEAELGKAIDAFNAANTKAVTYFPDMKRKVRVR